MLRVLWEISGSVFTDLSITLSASTFMQDTDCMMCFWIFVPWMQLHAVSKAKGTVMMWTTQRLKAPPSRNLADPNGMSALVRGCRVKGKIRKGLITKIIAKQI